MSTPLAVSAFRYGAPETARFEAVRVAHPIYRGLPPESPAPGIECRLVLRGDHPVARASLALAPELHGVEGVTGLIGHFEAQDAESAHVLLSEARVSLSARGAGRVLAPMNGSTWGRYRLALADERGDAPEPQPFLGEPVNPAAYAAWFESVGFEVAARYESRIDESPGEPAADARELAQRVAQAGIRVRTLDLDRFESESRILFELSLAAFADNPYYTPIGWDEFRAQYERLRGMLRPELVLIAEDAGAQPVAFQFAYLDPLTAATGGSPRAVVKTVATLPAARGMGLAGHMLDVLCERSVALGARSVIHALMHVANFSMKMSSRRRSRVFRRYALYTWRP